MIYLKKTTTHHVITRLVRVIQNFGVLGVLAVQNIFEITKGKTEVNATPSCHSGAGRYLDLFVKWIPAYAGMTMTPPLSQK